MEKATTRTVRTRGIIYSLLPRDLKFAIAIAIFIRTTINDRMIKIVKYKRSLVIYQATLHATHGMDISKEIIDSTVTSFFMLYILLREKHYV